MHEIVRNFMAEAYSPELIQLMEKAFGIFEAFEYVVPHGELMEVVMDESVSDIQNRSIHFRGVIENHLDYLVRQHLVTLSDECGLSDKILIVDALYRVQHLEDYTAYDYILHSDKDAIDAMSCILGELTSQEECYFLPLIDAVDEQSIELLKKFIDSKIVIDEPPAQRSIVKKIKAFVSTFGSDSVGVQMVLAGMKPGYPTKTYIPYVDNALKQTTDLAKAALDHFSILTISDTEGKNVVQLFREIAETTYNDLITTSRVEGELLKLIFALDQKEKIDYEKARLS